MLAQILFTLILWSSSINCIEFNIIELDHDLGHDTPYHVNAGSEPFSYEIIEASSKRGFWLAFGKFRAQDQMGTTVISPYSFNQNGITVDQIPIQQYFGEAAVIDVRDKVAKDDFYEISVQDVEDWVNTNGVFANNSIVLFNTGWEKGRYPDIEKYIGDAKGSEIDRFPGVGLEAMKAILNYEKTHGINFTAFGIDGPLLDVGGKPSLSAVLVASRNKYLIKNLKDLDKLPPKGARLMVLPIKIRNGTGGPARVLARLPY